MCKVLIFTNTTKIKDLKRLVEVSAKQLKSQGDGFGWVAQRPDFKLFGERSNDVENYKTTLDTTITPEEHLALPFLEQRQNFFGEFQPETRAFMAHGRISTNNKALVNVHPIVKHDWALIHNGVVTDHGPDYEMITENDSEHVLHHMANGGIEKLARTLTGYYAFGGFDPLGNLHVARDRIAQLYCLYVPEIESYIYGTTKDLLKDVCSDMQWYKKSATAKVLGDTYVRHDVDGHIYWKAFTSRGKDAYSARHSMASLGTQLPFTGETGEAAGKKYRTPTPGTASESSPVISLTEARNTKTAEEIAEANKTAATAGVRAGNLTATNAPKMFGHYLSKADRKKAQKKLAEECEDQREKWSLGKFFAFIRDSKNRYFVFDNKNAKVTRDAYLEKHPEYQIQYEVISEHGDILDPYNWTEPGSQRTRAETKERTRAEMIFDFEQAVVEEIRSAKGGQVENSVEACVM